MKIFGIVICSLLALLCQMAETDNAEIWNESRTACIVLETPTKETAPGKPVVLSVHVRTKEPYEVHWFVSHEGQAYEEITDCVDSDCSFVYTSECLSNDYVAIITKTGAGIGDQQIRKEASAHPEGKGIVFAPDLSLPENP